MPFLALTKGCLYLDPKMAISFALLVLGVALPTDMKLEKQVSLNMQLVDFKEGETAKKQVLVTVSDEGSGTSNFGNALGVHPCIFDVGEAFGSGLTVWSTQHVEQCASQKPPEAMFDADTGKLIHKGNKKLALHLETKMHSIKGLKDSPELYEGLKYDIAEYFLRIRDMICDKVPTDVCPTAECRISFKLFPQHVDAKTHGQATKDDPPSECDKARNEKALTAWKEALESFKSNPKVASFTLTRNERDREFSNFHKGSDPIGAVFDCSLERPPTPFSEEAKKYTDMTIKVEDCWKGGVAGANECLSDALKLFGIPGKPSAEMTAEMVGEVSKRAADGKIASKSCATDPHALFKKLPGDQVKLIKGA